MTMAAVATLRQHDGLPISLLTYPHFLYDSVSFTCSKGDGEHTKKAPVPETAQGLLVKSFSNC